MACQCPQHYTIKTSAFVYFCTMDPDLVRSIQFFLFRFVSLRSEIRGHPTPHPYPSPTVNSPAVSVLYRKDTAYDFFLDIFLSVNTIILQRECDENQVRVETFMWMSQGYSIFRNGNFLNFSPKENFVERIFCCMAPRWSVLVRGTPCSHTRYALLQINRKVVLFFMQNKILKQLFTDA